MSVTDFSLEERIRAQAAIMQNVQHDLTQIAAECTVRGIRITRSFLEDACALNERATAYTLGAATCARILSHPV